MGTTCIVWAMNRDGEWYFWGEGKNGPGWGEGAGLELPQVDAFAHAKKVMNEVPWIWGVKVVVV